MDQTASRTRIDVVDALRGLAALVVSVVFHYQHFNDPIAVFNRPFFQTPPISWFHRDGWLAVDLFFLLSGFVLTQKYRSTISEGRIDAKSFFFLRFSRLYPLHLATMIAAGGLAWAFMANYGRFPIPTANDSYHLILNVLFLQGTALRYDLSFNTPAWSLSAEAVCYVTFFIVCRHGRHMLPLTLGIAYLGAAMVRNDSIFEVFGGSFIGRALLGFFIGGLLVDVLESRYRPLALPVALGVLGFFIVTMLITPDWKNALPVGFDSSWRNLAFSLAIFPASFVICFEFKPLRRALENRVFLFAGKISYSVYLVHLPVQMALMLAFRAADIHVPFERVRFLLAYGACVIIVATLTYYLIEVPAQRALRDRLLGPSRQGARSRPVSQLDEVH